MNNSWNTNQNPQYPYGWNGGGGGNPYNPRFMPPQTYHQQTGWRPIPIPLA